VEDKDRYMAELKSVREKEHYLEEFVKRHSEELRDLIGTFKMLAEELLWDLYDQVLEDLSVEQVDEELENLIRDTLRNAWTKALNNPLLYTREFDFVQSLRYDIDF